MVKLFNISNIHVKEASETTDIALFHFCADAVKEWECNLKNCNKSCLFWFENTVYKQNGEKIQNKLCLLEAIKSNAYESLELEIDEFGNELKDDNHETGI